MIGPKRVLFLCTGNSARSQIAEGLLRELGRDRYQAFSAGTEPADQVHPMAVEAMHELGIDISHQRPQHLRAFDGQQFDLLITTCDQANEACPFYTGARQRLHWSLPDAALATGSDEQIREQFRKARDELERHITRPIAPDAPT